MALSEKDVESVARLARLEVSADERALYAKQLSVILDHAAGLNKADTKDVKATAHVLDLSNVWREDTVTPSLPREAVLANAPDKIKGCFRVPQIIES